jgi:hypothetical protein
MHTITPKINNEDPLITLQSLENKHFISILDSSELEAPSLPGDSLSLAEFKRWIKDAEKAPTVSILQAKEKWGSKRQKLEMIML